MKKIIYLLLLITTLSFAQQRRMILHQSYSTGANLDETTYYFNPDTEGIVQGVVSDAVALQNVTAINAALQSATTAGKTVFELPVMDAYFNTQGGWITDKFDVHDAAIKIPSNMHFKMNSNTVLRLQPTNANRHALLSMNYEDNAIITGGVLEGDKYEHTYLEIYDVSEAATTTTATVYIDREYARTVYEIPVTVSDAATNAAEITAYLDSISDLYATNSGTEIQIHGDPGVYVRLNDDDTDLSGINFSGGSDLGYGFGIQIYGANNPIIDNVTIRNFTGDCIFVGITGLRDPDTGLAPPRTYTYDTYDIKATKNLIIRNCTLDGGRRQGLSIVDCEGYLVEYNTIINTGKDIYTLPSAGIDLEAYRERNAAGVLREYAKIINGIIRYNTFNNNLRGDLVLFNPQFVEAHDNLMTNYIANLAGSNMNIHHNTLTGEHATLGQGISIRSYIIAVTGEELVHDVTIADNIIDDYRYGITISGNNFTVANNTITNLQAPTSIGISIQRETTNATISGNNISGNLGGDGIRNHFFNTDLENVTLDGNIVNITGGGNGLRLETLTGLGTGLNIINNTFNGDDVDIKVTDSENITFGAGNTYTTVTQSGNTNVTGL